MKSFSEEIQRIHKKISRRDQFALSRFGDGEWLAINKILATGLTEWTTTGDTEVYEIARTRLNRAFQYQHPQYIVGIMCACCLTHIRNIHSRMKQASGQDEANLTFANVFVNNNFSFFQKTLLPSLSARRVIVVANPSRVHPTALPIPVAQFYPIEDNAWLNAYEIADTIARDGHTDSVILFSGGAFASIAVPYLWEQNSTNTYIDIGSPLEWWGNPNPTWRLYFYDPAYANRICVWK